MTSRLCITITFVRFVFHAGDAFRLNEESTAADTKIPPRTKCQKLTKTFPVDPPAQEAPDPVQWQ